MPWRAWPRFEQEFKVARARLRNAKHRARAFVAGILVASFGGSFGLATTASASTLLIAVVALAFARETNGEFLNG